MSILLSALLAVLRLVRAAALNRRLGLPAALILVFAVAPTAAPALAAVAPAAGVPTAATVAADAAWLQTRLARWPDWSLPAPLPRPGQTDLTYPAWFAGTWQAHSHDLAGQEPDLRYVVRFGPDQRGAVVGDRAFNAAAIGHALLGEQLQGVRNDPRNPNRQLAQLTGDRQLESSVIGRRSTAPGAGGDSGMFVADELALQVLHGPGDPRVSRVETLSRYRRLGPGRIEAEQWQASYESPAQGLAATARHPWHGSLVLERLAEEPAPADGAPDP